jgi:hypothetical protein
MERLFGTAGFPWWWHTREDTVDKIDPDVLALDTRVYVAAVLRCLDLPLLPLEPVRMARALEAVVEDLRSVAGRRMDLEPAAAAARRLVERTESLGVVLERLATGDRDGGRIEAANRLLMRLSRVLVPLAYTTGDRFDHDLALPVPPLAGLQRARELATVDPRSDAFRFTLAALGRERNRAVHAMAEAADLVDGFLG